MKARLAILLAVLLVLITGCSEAVIGSDSELSNPTVASTIPPGPPTQARLNKARAHAVAFWLTRAPASAFPCLTAISGYGSFSNADSIASVGRVAIGVARGCRTPSNGEPGGTVGGGPGSIGFNYEYRWSYPRLCVVMTHEVGHILGFAHGATFQVMNRQARIGDANCPY